MAVAFAHLNEQQHFNPRENEKYSILALTDQAGKKAARLQSTQAESWKSHKNKKILEEGLEDFCFFDNSLCHIFKPNDQEKKTFSPQAQAVFYTTWPVDIQTHNLCKMAK